MKDFLLGGMEIVLAPSLYSIGSSFINSLYLNYSYSPRIDFTIDSADFRSHKQQSFCQLSMSPSYVVGIWAMTLIKNLSSYHFAKRADSDG